jgi:CDP-paratose 2-epimerase
MRILITGICGFVGSSVAEHLLETSEGLSVAGIDNLMRDGSEGNRFRLRKLGIQVVHGDIRAASDFESLPPADWVIDAAANASVLAGVQGSFSSRQLMEHNLAAAINVLEYCKKQAAGLVLLSSSRVYSIPALVSLPLKTSGTAFQLDDAKPLPQGVTRNGIGVDFSTRPPISLYGGTKLASEMIALEYGHAFDFPIWIDRCGVLAGSGQFGTAGQGIFSYWIHSHYARRPLRYVGFDGTGKQVRDAFHPRDLAALIQAQIATPRRDGQRIYTAGGGVDGAFSLAQLTAWCDARFQPHVPEPDLRPRPYDIPWLIMDSTDARRDFGWHREVGFEQLLEEIAQHAEQHPDWLERSGA